MQSREKSWAPGSRGSGSRPAPVQVRGEPGALALISSIRDNGVKCPVWGKHSRLSSEAQVTLDSVPRSSGQAGARQEW